MNLNKNILITGASGFIGTWLANELASNGYSIFGIDLRAPHIPAIWKGFSVSSCETTDFNKLMDGNSIFAVCHLAGGASVGSSFADPYGDFSSLLPSTAKLALYLSENHRGSKFIFFSSAAVYGNSYLSAIDESFPTNPISPYGVHKLLAENLLFNYSKLFDIQIIALRVFSIYGEGLKKQLIWDLSQKAIVSKKSNTKSITLKGTGQEVRDFLHVKDLCHFVHNILQQNIEQNAILNIASGQPKTVSEIAKILINGMDLDIEIDFSGIIPKGDPVSLLANIHSLNKLDIRPTIAVEDGLTFVAQWVKQLED